MISKKRGILLAILIAGAGAATTCAVAASAMRGSTGVKPSAMTWRGDQCKFVGQRGPRRYVLCFRPNRGGHGTFVERTGSGSRVMPVGRPTTKGDLLVGHWEWAALSPDGSTFLAQWSAECEVPITFFAPRDGSPVRSVTGERDWANSPTSLAYGWTNDARAIVRLPKTTCGYAAKRPGLYLIARSGERVLVIGKNPILRSVHARPASAFRRP